MVVLAQKEVYKMEYGGMLTLGMRTDFDSNAPLEKHAEGFSTMVFLIEGSGLHGLKKDWTGQ